MRTEPTTTFVTPMQQALLDAAEGALASSTGTAPRGHSKALLQRVLRALDRTRPKTERAIDIRVSYRTAHKLKREGVL